MTRFGAAMGMAVALATAASWAWAQTPAAPAQVRMLFVGIDKYSHGHDVDPKADESLHDLNGAVADVGLMKTTLSGAPYGLAVDNAPCRDAPWTPPAGAVPTSITLLDRCATRDAIIGALLSQIGAATANGLVLFYFAGHGSSHQQVGDDQLTGQNSTIVPADAWREEDKPVNDILDIELKRVIDAAEARGVSVLTIFDSCHSETATRDVSGKFKVNPGSRAAAPTSGPLPAGNAAALDAAIAGLPPAGASATPATPYRVHMAAAGDNQDAQERTDDAGQSHGAFTLALADTLSSRRGATYLEVAEQTYVTLQRFGTGESLTPGGAPCGPKRAGKPCDALASRGSAQAQDSHAEGPLAVPFLGLAVDERPGYQAVGGAGGSLTIQAGRAALVTSGSLFNVYRFPRTDTEVVATGKVTDVADNRAILALEVPASLQTGAGYWVEETWHNYGEQRLKVAIEEGSPDERALVKSLVDKLTGDLGYVHLVGADSDDPNGKADFIISLSGGQAAFQNSDHKTIVPAGVICRAGQARAACAADFARRLGAVTKAAANYFALLSLGDHTPTDHSKAHWGRIAVFPGGCPGTFPAEDCSEVDPAPDAGVTLLSRAQTNGGNLDVFVKNTSGKPKYRYTLLLSPDDFSVTVLSPPGYSDDPPLVTSTDYQGRFGRLGRATLLVLLTDNPINIETLHQEPVRDVNDASHNGLERLLLNAAQGRRDPGPAAGDFDVLTKNFLITN